MTTPMAVPCWDDAILRDFQTARATLFVTTENLPEINFGQTIINQSFTFNTTESSVILASGMLAVRAHLDDTVRVKQDVS